MRTFLIIFMLLTLINLQGTVWAMDFAFSNNKSEVIITSVHEENDITLIKALLKPAAHVTGPQSSYRGFITALRQKDPKSQSYRYSSCQSNSEDDKIIKSEATKARGLFDVLDELAHKRRVQDKEQEQQAQKIVAQTSALKTQIEKLQSKL